MRLTNKFWTALILVTLLSLNSFAYQSEKMTAKQAAKEALKTRVDNLFLSIETAVNSGDCSVLVSINDLPKEFSTLLTNLGYKLDYYEFKKVERILWCE